MVTFCTHLPLCIVPYPPSVCSKVLVFFGNEAFNWLIRDSTLESDLAMSMVSILDKMLHTAFTDCAKDLKCTCSTSSCNIQTTQGNNN